MQMLDAVRQVPQHHCQHIFCTMLRLFRVPYQSVHLPLQAIVLKAEVCASTLQLVLLSLRDHSNVDQSSCELKIEAQQSNLTNTDSNLTDEVAEFLLLCSKQCAVVSFSAHAAIKASGLSFCKNKVT